MTLHPREPLVLDLSELSGDDQMRLMDALIDGTRFTLPARIDLDGRPLLDRDDVARLQRAADRVTIAVLLLVAIIVIIQLGRLAIGGGA